MPSAEPDSKHTPYFTHVLRLHLTNMSHVHFLPFYFTPSNHIVALTFWYIWRVYCCYLCAAWTLRNAWIYSHFTVCPNALFRGQSNSGSRGSGSSLKTRRPVPMWPRAHKETEAYAAQGRGFIHSRVGVSWGQQRAESNTLFCTHWLWSCSTGSRYMHSLRAAVYWLVRNQVHFWFCCPTDKERCNRENRWRLRLPCTRCRSAASEG